jgi:hypothetical protein
MRPSDAPPRRFKTLVRSSGDLATLGDFAPHACPRPASSQWQTPSVRAGRKPRASRVRACEARPQAPHRPSGCPSGQLSLCPTSVTPLEAPLIGQDSSDNKPALGDGDKESEKFFRQRLQPRRVGKGAPSRRAHHGQAKAVLMRKMVGTPSGAHSRDRWLCPPYGSGEPVMPTTPRRRRSPPRRRRSPCAPASLPARQCSRRRNAPA